jgi:endonuclease YncB( thermonuclease family)
MRKPSNIMPVLVFLFITLLTYPYKLLAGESVVYRVIDGDTIKVDDGTKKITVRLVGIDAPEVSHAKNEPGQAFSQSATKHLAALVLNHTVDITSYGQDKYGRTLGEVFDDGKNINLEMIKAGLAEVYRGTPAPGQNLDPYWQAEKEARMAKRGMWVLADKYESPREWRG